MISQSQIREIKSLASEQIDIVFDHLGIDYDEAYGYGREIRTKCPVHEGDNRTAFRYSLDGHSWQCFTNNCHDGRWDIFGLVRAVKEKEGETLSFVESVRYIAKIVGFNLTDEILTSEDMLLQGLLRRKKKQTLQSKKEFPIDLDLILNRKFGSQFFTEQGFTEETLKNFYVHECFDRTKVMQNRAVVPILSENGKQILGVTGRTLYPECHVCSYYHNTNSTCPIDDINVFANPKWLHYGFNKNTVLYNLHNAKSSFQQSKMAIITEGVKETWWLKQHGIDAVSILGINFSKEQRNKLLSIGCTKIILCLDNDEKSIDATEKIIENNGHIFKFFDLSRFYGNAVDLDDIKEMSTIKEKIKEIECL